MTRAVFLLPESGERAWSTLVGLRTRELIDALMQLDVEVLELPVEELIAQPDLSQDTISAFAPDFITAPNFNYLLQASRRCDDLFEQPLPVVALWDDPLGALSGLSTQRAWFWEREALERGANSATSAQSEAATPPLQFRRVMDRPNLLHVGWDSGHIAAVRELGLARPSNLHWQPVATYDSFLQMGARPSEPVRDVAFCGNLYLHTLQQMESQQPAPMRELVAHICEKKIAALHRSLWDILKEEIVHLPAELRRQQGLAFDGKQFWDLYLLLSWYALNTRVRLALLTGIERPVELFGMFGDPETVQLLAQHPTLHFAGNAEHFRELPEIYATTRINVCVCNGLVYQGTPSKLIDCLASGGFALCDAKDDLVRLFGPVVEEIFFRNGEELNDKIAYFLDRPRRRQEIVAELRCQITRECTPKRTFEQVLTQLSARRSPNTATPARR